jgi:galactokinase
MKGVMHNFGTSIAGFNAVVHTNVPTGGGLSSSAALEVATFRFMELLTGKVYDR